MKEHIVKDLGMKKVGNKNQRFALIKCPECGSIDERRVRSDSNPRCRACTMKYIRSKKAPSSSGSEGDTAKNHPLNRLYRIWRGMNRRCYEPNAMGYNVYGAKGVTVCDEWKSSYKAFKKWSLLNGYTDEMTIDKDELCELNNIHPKKYSPETCIWKTASENAKNNEKIPESDLEEIATRLDKGESVHEIANVYGVKYKTVLARTKHLRQKKYVDKTSKR
jgi:transposase-like protein